MIQLILFFPVRWGINIFFDTLALSIHSTVLLIMMLHVRLVHSGKRPERRRPSSPVHQLRVPGQSNAWELQSVYWYTDHWRQVH